MHFPTQSYIGDFSAPPDMTQCVIISYITHLVMQSEGNRHSQESGHPNKY